MRGRAIRVSVFLVVCLVLVSAPHAAFGGPAAEGPWKIVPHQQSEIDAAGGGSSLLAMPDTPARLLDYGTFDHPDYYYAVVKSAPTGTYYRQAGFNPAGTKIVAQKSWNDGTYDRTEIVLMNPDGSGEQVISAGDSGTGDIYGYMNPFWSDDGTAVGYAEVHIANPNKIIRYVVSTESSSYIYEPTSPDDVSNPDFVGSSTSTIVFWAYGAGSVADLFTWDGTTLTNLTNTADYKEYEPVSNDDGTVIVYWSGETTAEPTNTTHTLTYSSGSWTKDVAFTPMADTYWSYWSGQADNYIATTVMSTKDVELYDSDGDFVLDLTGATYEGGSGQWNFVGSMPEAPNGEFALTSNAARTTAGRDIVIAAPRDEMYVDDGGSDANPGTQAAPFATIQKGVTEVAADGTVHVAAGTYAEQVTITKSLDLVGAGAGSSIIQAPSSLPPSSSQDSAIVIVDGSGVDAEITGFTVTGPGPTSCGSIVAGIIVRDGANANIHDNSILDIRDSTFSGCQNGIAIIVGRQSWSTTGTATIANNTITGYQKGGIFVDNTGSSATITSNTITGVGTTSVIAQNGIQISRGATATLSGNAVTGNSFHLAGSSWDWGSAGVLLYQSGAVTMSGGNSLSGNDTNLYILGATALTLGAETIGASTAPAGYGYWVANLSTLSLDLTSIIFPTGSSNFDIEDRVFHGVDDVAYGLATWVPANLYVTPLEGSIKNAVAKASSGDTVNVAAGTFTESGQIVIDKSLTIDGQGCGSTIIKTDQNTGTAGDPRGWWLVNAGVVLDLSDATLDGTGWKIFQALRIKGSGTITGVCFTQIQYDASGASYNGVAVVAAGDGTVDVSGSTFGDIGRIGVFYFGSGVNGSEYAGNTYVGKGAGNWLDYGVELGGGAQATILDSSISACQGVASVDGSTSAGILATTYYGAGTQGTITGNHLTGNTTAVVVGYDGTDGSVVTIFDNNLGGNTTSGVESTGPAVNATGNWWGSADPATVKTAANGGTFVDYTPWLASGTDTSTDLGFQGDFATLWVDDDSPQTGTTGRIQEGIDLVTASTVHVAAGLYVENPTIDTLLYLLGAQEDVAVSGRTAGAATESTIQGLVTVAASDVEINGFTLTNPSQTNAVSISKTTPSYHDISIAYNLVDTVGSTSLASNVHSVLLNGADQVTVANNGFSNIHAGTKSASAIGSLDSTNTDPAEELVIEGNVFGNITSTKGAYGVILNNGAGTPDTQIVDNTFANLDGGWTHAIGLEGPTDGALVTGNQFSALTADGDDNVCVHLEDNPDGGTVTITGNKFNGTTFYGVRIHDDGLPGGVGPVYTYVVDAECSYWGDDDGPGPVGPDGGAYVSPQVDYQPWSNADLSTCTGAIPATVSMQVTGSPAAVNGVVTMDTLVTADDVYGIALNVQYDSTKLEFQVPPTSTRNDVAAAGWYWDYVPENFVAVTGGRRLSGAMQDNLHPSPAMLTGQSVATWNFKCLQEGTHDLTYSTAAGTGTEVSDKDGFPISATISNATVTCLTTASVEGYIKLQGRVQGTLSPAGWQGAVVRLTCSDTVGGCAGYGPYEMTTDIYGYYQHSKTDPGTGVVLGNYTATVTRRAYLGATKATPVVIVAGTNTINVLATAPRLLGGDVVVDVDQKIDIADMSAIGYVFGTYITPDTNQDVNGDGWVNIYDLAMAGGNFYKTTSVWP